MRTEMWNDDKLEGYMLSAQFSLRGSLSLWDISNNSKNIVFSVPVFTYSPVSSLPWLNLIPDLSLLCSFSSQLSSLSLIFLWKSVMTPNPSVPLSYPPFQFHLCMLLLTGGDFLFFHSWLFMFLLSSVWILASVLAWGFHLGMTWLIHTYIHESRCTHTCLHTDKGRKACTCMQLYVVKLVISQRSWKELPQAWLSSGEMNRDKMSLKRSSFSLSWN